MREAKYKVGDVVAFDASRLHESEEDDAIWFADYGIDGGSTAIAVISGVNLECPNREELVFDGSVWYDLALIDGETVQAEEDVDVMNLLGGMECTVKDAYRNVLLNHDYSSLEWLEKNFSILNGQPSAKARDFVIAVDSGMVYQPAIVSVVGYPELTDHPTEIIVTPSCWIRSSVKGAPHIRTYTLDLTGLDRWVVLRAPVDLDF